MMRHAGVLSALLLTAALLCAMPGLLQVPQQQGRADERLRPAQMQTLTVWLMPGDVGDRKLISQLCAAFEKENDGVRIFLRVVTADEFTGETAVLPDVALFETGDLAVPEKIFLPLEEGLGSSGQFAGVQRAVPLWLAPNVLSIPQSWLHGERAAVPKTDSLLAAATAVPEQDVNALLDAEALPWTMLLQRGALEESEGVGWQQLLACCPAELRAQLVSAMLGKDAEVAVPSPEPEDWVTTIPFSRTASPTPMPAVTEPARLETLLQHQTRLKKGEAVSAFIPVAVSERVRYAALCRDGEQARGFVQFLMQQREEALAHALIPPGVEKAVPDQLIQALLDAYRVTALPNAFVHTREEIRQLCAEAFARCEDPMRTLLGLR